MKNLTDVFLDSAPSRFKLSFGIVKNVVLKSVSNEVRRNKNGVKIDKNCYMNFAQLDPEQNNKIVAESQFSYFNIDKPEYAIDNFTHQYNQLVEILKTTVPLDNLTTALRTFAVVLKSHSDLFVKIKKVSGKPNAKLTKEISLAQENIVAGFIDAVGDYVGTDGVLVSILVVTGPNGKFFDLPREDKGFITRQDGGRKLTLDVKYKRWFAERAKAEKAKSEDIGGETIIDEDSIIIDDDQEMDGI